MQHTTNYNLPQWEDTDAVKREDMNAAMSAIDTAIAGGAKIAWGSYQGRGAYYRGSPNVLTFDFEPKLVIVQDKSGSMIDVINGQEGYSTLIMVRGLEISYFLNTNDNWSYVTWDGNTVSWWSTQSAQRQLNEANHTYVYVAIG